MLLVKDTMKSGLPVTIRPLNVQEANYCASMSKTYRERSGSVVECLTQDRRAVGSCLTGVTALCPWARTFILAKYWFNPGRPVPL